MTDPVISSEQPAPPPSPTPLSVPLSVPLSQLTARADGSGGAEREPVRQARLAALTRLAEAQPAAIRRRLDERLQRLGEELQARLAAAAPMPSVQAPATPDPLAELLAYIGQQASTVSALPMPQENGLSTVDRENPPKPARPPIGSHAGAPELKAVAYFRDAWSRLSTEQQLTQTLAQAPENAGPMNSQHLVLRSLQAMRDLAPDYLQGFMSYIDTLIWLEQVDPTRAPVSRAASSDSKKKPRSGQGATAKS